MTGRYSPYFGVAHKSIAETHGQTVGMQGTVAVFLGNSVHVRRICGGNGIALAILFLCDTPAVVDATRCLSE